MLYGDSYLPCDYAAVEAAFLASGKPGLMTVYRNEGQWDTSNVEFDDGRILAYDKKQPHARGCGTSITAWASSGARPSTRVPDGEPCDLAALYQELLAATANWRRSKSPSASTRSDRSPGSRSCARISRQVAEDA